MYTLDRAEEYLKALEARKGARGKIKRALQIKEREFSATEKRYVDGWITMGFESEAIAIAYDRTVVKTGKLSWAYMDSILKNWHSKELHTAQQVLDKDSARTKSTSSASARTGGHKHGEPNRAEVERMTRILERIKED